MAYIEKVDLLLAAIESEENGDQTNRMKLENMIRKSIVNEKRDNIYYGTVYVQKNDKKAVNRVLANS